MKKILFFFAILNLFAASNYAQIKTPAASPAASVMQTIGLTDVTVDYSRPSVKGRTIFAENGLVPFNNMWRTGANAATKITFSNDVKINDQELKAGTYAILTLPTATVWSIYFYSYESSSWPTYVDATPVLSVLMNVSTNTFFTETFTIEFNNVGADMAVLTLRWENTTASVNVNVNTDSMVMSNIESVMAGPSSNDYYNAANYYLTTGRDLNQALTWIQKATKGDNPKFWQVRREALILAGLGRYKEAITAATLSKELAMKAGNDEYVKMNEADIADWNKK
ncbi:MAG TPA: DUF2911 domain-containing protein [Saprospiraceae bacterium]|nr:DUF2911 domain-containing protein [Lewinellaceae bacterium]HRX29137.1 DUF2911 domain-containing protein [Saprospiraceae bacterium]